MQAMDDQQLFRVIMPAADIEPSQRFYASLLDQPGMRVSPGRHYFRCGSVTLAVYSPAADGDDRVPHANFDHIYLAVTDLEAHFLRAKSLDCLRNAIGDGGLPMGEIAVRPWGERSFYADDPFGNPICLVDANTVFSGH